ncbi:uncharacterized protein LOC115221013 [Octopus sinensis]|uniref:Uncharacterized protein LOC115221013 n=1 Tax=Octopus sinensis TaxID=2607531 RepID=A0A7E6FF84_9MOLL|nr:uncharacterized protein LOC115221013 [Octopus sinensis]
MAKKGQRIPKEKLNKKLQDHTKNELEKYNKLYNPQAHKETTTKEPEGLTLAQIIQKKRMKKKKQYKPGLDPKKDIWNNIDALEKKVDYNLSVLACTNQIENPYVDEEIWNQFTSLDFVQSMDMFLNNTMYDVQGLLKKLSVN